MSPSVNPANITYDNRVPYVTVNEVKNSPIASSVDLTNLIPGGDAAAQTAAIQQLIYMASAQADNICLGATGTLCATINTEQGRYRANRQGFIVVHPAYWPILEVDSFAIGSLPAAQTPITVSSSNCWVESRQFTVTANASTLTTVGPLDFGSMGYTNQAQFCTYTYVNGFANTTLAASASASATSIQVASITGIYAGQPLTIWDGSSTETVMIASSWNGTSTTLPINTALTYAHASAVNVSALPASVKQAVIHLVVAAIKQRGEGGLVIAEVGAPTAATSNDITSSSDLARARDLLHAFLQVWGRT